MTRQQRRIDRVAAPIEVSPDEAHFCRRAAHSMNEKNALAVRPLGENSSGSVICMPIFQFTISLAMNPRAWHVPITWTPASTCSF
jgi:hypothetical protein